MDENGRRVGAKRFWIMQRNQHVLGPRKNIRGSYSLSHPLVCMEIWGWGDGSWDLKIHRVG